MSTTIAHDYMPSTRPAFIALVASAVALVLSITLPLVLHTTKTVFVHVGTTSSVGSSGGSSTPTGPQLVRARHGG